MWFLIVIGIMFVLAPKLFKWLFIALGHKPIEKDSNEWVKTESGIWKP